MTKIYSKFMAKVIKVDVQIFFILAARIAFWVFVHCILGYFCIALKLRILLAIHELNLLPCSLPVVAIILTCQIIFLHYNTTIINSWTPPSEPIFLGAPPFFGQKYIMTHPLFCQPTPSHK
jgi:hypothetical protein